MENNGKQCKCPFCFGVFVPEAVAFRAETVYTQQDLEDFSPEEAKVKTKYLEAADPVLEKFWKKFPGSEVKTEYDKHAVIHNHMNEYMSGNYLRDEDGFLNAVIDSEGNTSKIRICPHCHNCLPFEFGKYPVKYISIVGITSSGKTVYLSQFLKKIKDFLTRVDLTIMGGHEEVEDFVRKHRIAKGVPLPTGNAADVLTPPLPINVRNRKTDERYTLVFYDIAGENCVKPSQMEKYGPFIVNADGIVVIVDPKQFYDLFDLEEDSDGEDEIERPEKVVEAMYNAFISASNEGGKSKVPLAAALSKSDVLKGYFQNRNRGSNILQQIDYRQYDGFGFPYDDFINISTEIRRLLGNKDFIKGVTFTNTLSECFETQEFFAFSALNVVPVMETDSEGEEYFTIDEDPETVRIEEPIFWILYKLGLIDRARKKGSGKVNESEKKKGSGLFGHKK